MSVRRDTLAAVAKPARIGPSLLAADFSRLAEEVGRIEPHVDFLHVDVMDGHFVPNLTLGMPVIESLRPVTGLYFDCHLMVTNPASLFAPLEEAGADLVTVHIEVHPDPTPVAARARELGMDFGLVINPPTPFAAVEPFVELCDWLLVMSVHPGFGGQAFIPEVLPKVEAARKWVDSHGLAADIEIDGGITPDTARLARSAGADLFVAGTAIFRAPDPVEAAQGLRAAVDEVA
jgi:ribulose-phosphate 3-epimerase